MKEKLLLGYLLLLFAPVSGIAQQLLNLDTEITDTVKSRILNSGQQIVVRLPKNYNKNATRYPVIYYFDAQDQGLGNLVAVNVDRLTWTKDIPEVITVGILQWDRSHLSIERMGEKANNFLNYLNAELIPYINKKYRTEDYRIFIGHSLGGQFVTYGMTRYPQLFNGVVAISPALSYAASEKWFQRLTLKAMGEFRKTKLSRPIRYFFCVGNSGFQDSEFKTGAFELNTLLENSEQQNFFWNFQYLDNFSHSNTPNAGISMGLLHIFHDWQFPEITAAGILVDNKGDALKELSRQEQKIRESYQVDLPIPKQFYWYFARHCIEKGKLADARVIIDKFIQRDPADPMPYKTMGDLMEANKDYSQSIRYYEIALTKLAKEDKAYKEYSEKIMELRKRLGQPDKN
ncbi:MAG: hypothetical protein DI535_03960 [Citrobacter freundii]|nr:MAG: hypothetical protein DI535_03960 [Citrobacter freundii]